MDRGLFSTCLSISAMLVSNTGKMINMHHEGAKSVVVDAALTLYDELEEIIAQKEAAEKALEEAEFAQHAAEREAVERAASKAEQASVEDAQAAASGLSAENVQERDV